MGLKETIKKLIEQYGEDVTHIKITTVENEYGELIEDQRTETTIKAIVDSAVVTSFARQLFGIVDSVKQSLLIAPEIDVDKSDLFVVDGKERNINSINDVHYKGETVVRQIILE